MADYIDIVTDAGRFDALAAGPEDGRAVMLLHGFPEAAIQWTSQLDTLAGAQCRAIAVDQRGYSPGVRPEQVSEYRLELLVADVIAIADQLGWHRFDLVGHDWGAVVAWAVAAAHPDRLRTLTALSVPHPTGFARAVAEDEDQAQRSAYMQVFRSSSAEKTLLADDAAKLRAIYQGKVSAPHVDDYVARLSEPGALTAALNWYRAMKYSGAVDPVEVPTLYVWSTEDVAVGSTAALDCEQYVTGPYRFEMIEDVSHWMSDEAPEVVSKLVLEHLIAHP
ncbi:alpha/beta fold hydrolase [Allosaccharopolyspora coralli]|uniref:Alpha/beta fold hydrolase n=1 Tax=Allosaccharopolyspora coralli TaxID=2665642 RepID=A0A5Q3Q8R9_9PSEU|nr:alpha/beta hydrolase [Allosaccharopolyspora coralli]QGK69826.1 alpha/beta fold hydrolase [Allosaccharopolyspora coralli]